MLAHIRHSEYVNCYCWEQCQEDYSGGSLMKQYGDSFIKSYL